MRKGDDLTTFIVPKVEKIRSLNLPDPQGPVQACSGKALPLSSFQSLIDTLFSGVCLFSSLLVELSDNTRYNTWVGIAQSVLRLDTGWTIRGSYSGGGEIFRTRPERSWGPPSLLRNCCRG